MLIEKNGHKKVKGCVKNGLINCSYKRLNINGLLIEEFIALLPLIYYSEVKKFVLTSDKNYKKSDFIIKKNIVKTRQGVNFLLSTIDAGILWETYIAKIHHYSKLKDKTVLDVGAAFGDTSLWFAKQGCKKIFAVEPLSNNYKALMANLKLNNSKKNKVKCIKAAVGIDGNVTLTYTNSPGIFGGASAYKKVGKMNELVQSFSISHLLDKLNLKEVDILKMDCKGGEVYINAEDLKRITTHIQIELFDLNSATTKKLINLIGNSGFNYYTTKNNMLYAERKSSIT